MIYKLINMVLALIKEIGKNIETKTKKNIYKLQIKKYNHDVCQIK